MNRIKLIAHRGYQRLYPENSLLSFVEAIKAGALFVETDVQLSADTQPVLYHDRHLHRASGRMGAIHDYDFQQLCSIPNHEPKRFGDHFLGQTITPLADLVALLQTHPQVHAFVEVKRCTIAAHGIDRTYDNIIRVLQPVATQCTLMSFSVPFVKHAFSQGWPDIGVVLTHWKDQQKQEIQQLKPNYLFCNVEKLPKTGSLVIAGTKTAIYEIDSADEAHSLCERGIDFIETFAFADMHHALNGSGGVRR